MTDIALTAAQRSSLLSLQQTQTLSDRTQTRLTTGREVNSVVDDAVNFFRAQALTDRGSLTLHCAGTKLTRALAP